MQLWLLISITTVKKPLKATTVSHSEIEATVKTLLSKIGMKYSQHFFSLAETSKIHVN